MIEVHIKSLCAFPMITEDLARSSADFKSLSYVAVYHDYKKCLIKVEIKLLLIDNGVRIMHLTSIRMYIDFYSALIFT